MVIVVDALYVGHAAGVPARMAHLLVAPGVVDCDRGSGRRTDANANADWRAGGMTPDHTINLTPFRRDWQRST
jgi:hypothetical protein